MVVLGAIEVEGMQHLSIPNTSHIHVGLHHSLVLPEELKVHLVLILAALPRGQLKELRPEGRGDGERGEGRRNMGGEGWGLRMRGGRGKIKQWKETKGR